jgi:peptide/nickel transport system substrate-binding protein
VGHPGRRRPRAGLDHLRRAGRDRPGRRPAPDRPHVAVALRLHRARHLRVQPDRRHRRDPLHGQPRHRDRADVPGRRVPDPPHGDRVHLDVHVIAGWSDWVASNQIITRNLRDIGIDSQVALEPDWGAWSPNAFAAKFPTLLWQGGSQGSPYGYFYANLSRNAYIPSGQDATATGNWEHFSHVGATTLLNQWKVTLSEKNQHPLATQLEKLWLQDLPIIPVVIGARWSTYSTKYFHGFPTKPNFYADPIFTTNPDNILLFTRIAPGGRAGT